jgi:hypothetical protein
MSHREREKRERRERGREREGGERDVLGLYFAKDIYILA